MTFGIMSWSLVAAIVLALLLGGDFRWLAEVRIRGWWVLALALAVKVGLAAFYAPATSWAQPLVFALVAAGAALNWRLPGIPVVALGLCLNVLVVGANGGQMPLSGAAAAAAGHPKLTHATALEAPETAGSHLAWLDDRVPFPPTRQVMSVGDVLVMAGGIWLVVGLTRPTRLGFIRAGAHSNAAT